MGRIYRGRFAPSPTGPAHLGTARSALLAWLRARREGGVFVLRMEDLDPPRVQRGAAEAMLRDLRWLGLDWDEGPDIGGPLAPYVQSERLPLYDAALEVLAPRLFACSCSRKELAGRAVYPGTCRGGPTHPGRPVALRFRMPSPPPFEDRFRGASPAGLGAGDFVVRRKDGLHAYHLACAVDDVTMGMTEVLRGDDLLDSTPRQLALIDALGARRPAYCHVPLVVGDDGVRLAKRHGSIAVAAFRDAGWAPEALVGRLAESAGLHDGSPIAPRDLVPRFALARLASRPRPVRTSR
jgi:glutamyl-tRNA synthetase